MKSLLVGLAFFVSWAPPTQTQRMPEREEVLAQGMTDTDGGLSLTLVPLYVEKPSDLLSVYWAVETDENTILDTHGFHAHIDEELSILSSHATVWDKANANNSRLFNSFTGRISELYGGKTITIEADATGFEGADKTYRKATVTMKLTIPK